MEGWMDGWMNPQHNSQWSKQSSLMPSINPLTSVNLFQTASVFSKPLHDIVSFPRQSVRGAAACAGRSITTHC